MTWRYLTFPSYHEIEPAWSQVFLTFNTKKMVKIEFESPQDLTDEKKLMLVTFVSRIGFAVIHLSFMRLEADGGENVSNESLQAIAAFCSAVNIDCQIKFTGIIYSVNGNLVNYQDFSDAEII